MENYNNRFLKYNPFLANPDKFYKDKSGLILPATCPPKNILQGKRITAIDFFSGAGGMSCGLIDAGVNVIAAVEYDIGAVDTYMINLGANPCKMIFIEKSDQERAVKYFDKKLQSALKRDPGKVLPEGFAVSGSNRKRVCPTWYEGVKYIFVGDVRKLTTERIFKEMNIERIDMVVGCPPCQGFSRLGKRNVMDPRNSLVFEFARFVVEIKPLTLVFENVPQIADMVTPEGIPVMDAFCRILEDGDFSTVEALKRSIFNTAGIVGALRTKNNKKEKPKKSKHKSAEVKKIDYEPDLFEESAVNG
ncbi:MAG: DNA cytosine methyltransferase [bacterium]